MRVGILGGTFDPVHLGHLILAECARQQLKLDRVLFVPAGDPWRKASRQVSPAWQRVAMTRLAIADNHAFELDEREVKRVGPTYTLDTLKEVRAALGADTELYFLLGEDSLADLSHWHDPAGIIAAATLAVAPRRDSEAQDWGLLGEARVERVDMPYIGISSTDLRERARRGESLRYMVPEAVGAYIREHGLYRLG